MGEQRPEMHHTRDDGTTERKERRLDLSVPQVAGSALAAVAAAVLASRIGVYGTILGAGVVSVVATCGGSLFQHLFRRTGEQIRDATRYARPNGMRPPGGSPEAGPPAFGEPPGHGEFGEPTTHGTRVRGRRRSALAAVVVFVLAMVGITGYELASGRDLSGGRGTTVGTAVRGGGGGAADGGSPSPSSPVRDGGAERHAHGDGGQDGGSEEGGGRGGPSGPAGDHNSGTESGSGSDSGSGSGDDPGADGGDADLPAPGPSGSTGAQSPAAPDPTSSAPGPSAPDAPSGQQPGPDPGAGP
ncbi:hypothetical protein OTC26_023680 [Streptomyces tirandamycinicus]|uniref:hypothetical protein n=1 Tax=Streptomyces tirandamycinicus TaxID=2174846 RepID=UPI00226E9BD0|nr:hypothetical protein [Streptomyces tirandamycinicus]MCY0982484.1 hypothetical protein [Streptomyces tirandamycinicus]